jgi:plasmid maintenance system antidote protein VapI
MLATPPRTAADFRALIAYHALRIYEFAPVVGLHPSRLSLVLHGRAPLTADLAERLTRAIEEAARA